MAANSFESAEVQRGGCSKERRRKIKRVRFGDSYHRCVDRIRHQAFGICRKIDERRTRRCGDLYDGTKVYGIFETSLGVRDKIT